MKDVADETILKEKKLFLVPIFSRFFYQNQNKYKFFKKKLFRTRKIVQLGLKKK
jgi:hypothetical protein